MINDDFLLLINLLNIFCVHKMSDKGEKCISLFPKGQDDNLLMSAHLFLDSCFEASNLNFDCCHLGFLEPEVLFG